MSSKPLPRFQPSALAIAVLLATSALPGAFAQGTPAAPVQRTYAMEPGPLDEALLRLSTAAGMGLSFEPSLVDGLRSPGLRGSYGNEEALRRVLDAAAALPRPAAETFTVTTATVSARSNNRFTWDFAGTSSVITGNTITIQVTTPTGLVTLGTTTVPVTGRWRLTVNNITTVVPSANPTATITSAQGTVRTVSVTAN